MALAAEQENKALAEKMRAEVVHAEAQVPQAIADAFRRGNFGLDYVAEDS